MTVCGLSGFANVIVRLSDTGPVVLGVKVTLIVHGGARTTIVNGNFGPLPLGLLQLFVCAKFPGFIPEIPMPLIVKGAVPALVIVTGWAVLLVPCCWFPNASVVAETFAIGAMPVPVKETIAEGVEPTNVIVNVELAGPAVVGEKDTLEVQLPVLAANFLFTQACPTEKGVEAVTARLWIVIALVPVFVRVSFFDIVVPTSWLPKSMDVEETTIWAWSRGVSPSVIRTASANDPRS